MGVGGYPVGIGGYPLDIDTSVPACLPLPGEIKDDISVNTIHTHTLNQANMCAHERKEAEI